MPFSITLIILYWKYSSMSMCLWKNSSKERRFVYYV
nr:MAG TPA: hypothetical protein [Caudoviricetes sp.]